ncbi:MAG TPA: hypothetical protein VF979_05765 [Streptosporangiaceae bacterium]
MKTLVPFAAITTLIGSMITVAVPPALDSAALAAPRACAWRTVASPSRGVSATLSAVAATSAKDAWAVGSYDTGSGFLTLIEHWNGSAWKVVPSVNPAVGKHQTSTLSGVVAISPSNAWAVGFYEKSTTNFRTLVEHWNGSVWSVVKSPNADSGENVLAAVAAVSGSDIWAVGYRHGPGAPGGGARKTLVEHWNGSKWRIVPSPSPGPARGDGFLFGVAATSARQAWAVGSEPSRFSSTLAIRWNGTKWLTAKTANPGQGDRFLQAVAAPSARFALAVGSDLNGNQTRALGEKWNGSAWSLVPTASPGRDFNSLQAVAARNSSHAWAVGTRRANPRARFTTLIEHWDGHAWTPAPAPSPGAGDDWLFGAAAVPRSGFWAVGFAGPHTLIERFC